MACIGFFTALNVMALKPKEYPDSFLIPERAVIATGDASKSGKLVAILYDTSDLHFTDPSAPRFLFLDRKGKVALGIGGYLKGTVQYDFDGSVDGSGFNTFDIAVPNDPARRSQFFADASHSVIFLQMVGHSDKIGYYQVYLQTSFTGDGPTGYGLKMKQAYVKVGYVTLGLANSTFVDGAAGTPVVETQGPTGEMSRKNVLLRYAPRFSDHFSAAVGVEMPSVSMTNNTTNEKINPRVPDIPVYLQYEWGGGDSHIRLSGLLRNLSYRDLTEQKNRMVTGWAVQLSGLASVFKGFTLFYQGAYGKGYGAYINDLGGNGLDLAFSETPGRMEAVRASNFEVGARYNVTPKLFMSAVYSQANTYGVGHLGADTYRYARYLGVNGFYEVIPDLTVGLQYVRGMRKDYSGESGHANRIMASLQFNF